MQKYISILFFITVFCASVSAAVNPIKFRRICSSGNDNVLFWFPTIDTCSSFKMYIIWGRIGTSGSYTQLATITNKQTDTYSHVGANIGGAKHWYYYIEYIDSCGPNFYINSDSLDVIISQNYPSFIDSVSVDILTNKVVMGWEQNKSTNFALYDPFYQKTNNPATYDYVVGPQGIRDTFVIDNNLSHNPSTMPLKYDLGTRDSCGNTGVFGTNPHQTIFLTTTIDTCKKTCELVWTPYSFTFIDNNGNKINVGWQKVWKYYIFKKINANQFLLIDSVSSTTLSYNDNITLGQQIQYFVRAKKDTTIYVSSSSNLVSFSTRLRIDPLNTNLLNVSVDPITNDRITVSIENKNNEECSNYDIFRSSNSSDAKIKVGSISNNATNNNIGVFNDILDATSSVYYYQIYAYNLCMMKTDSTNVSNSILLNTSELGNNNILTWNTYNYWSNGIERYRIYRGILQNNGNITFSLLDYVSFSDTVYTDQAVPNKFDGQGICYYVQAVQNTGSTYVEESNSNHSCIIGDMTVFIPNAFNPFGINRVFRPEGRFINFINSSMIIYDRWGGKIIEFLDITNGWDGKDSKGQYCQVGVYLYVIKIMSSNGKEETKTGLVTLID